MSELKEFINRLIVGVHNANFRDIIKASTGNQITKIDSRLKYELKYVKSTFNKNLSTISSTVKKDYRGRANELSNYMEVIVKDEINKLQPFKAYRGKQSAGYPDLYVETKNSCFYLEIKIFQLKTQDSSLRSFYYKPSKQSKITKSCPHILIAFEVESIGKNNRSPFVINNFKIIDLYNLKVNLKPEFNASNIEICNCTQI